MQTYSSILVSFFKQIVAVIKEKNNLSGRTIEIINKLLTTLMYKIYLKVSERRVIIIIRTIIQDTNRF